jgi:sugar fermentation stimulation protein A
MKLAGLSEQGMRTAVLFVVHWHLARFFMPDYHTDLTFSQTLLRVRDRVRVLPVAVRWNRDLSLSAEGRLLEIPWNYVEEEAKDRGSYLLILKLEGEKNVRVGKLGEVRLRRGFYIYAGSAMANLTRRMERHRRIRKRHHWHIDELRDVAEFHAVLPVRSSARLECEVAAALSKAAEWSVPGFGASDCSCATHLFGVRSDPLRTVGFQRLLQYFRMDRYHDSDP